MAPRKRQRTLFEYGDFSSSPAKQPRKRTRKQHSPSVSADESDSDPGNIKFERGASRSKTASSPASTEEIPAPKRSTRSKKGCETKPEVINLDSSEAEGNVSPSSVVEPDQDSDVERSGKRRRPVGGRKETDSDGEPPRKIRRLLRGRRQSASPSPNDAQSNEDEEDLMAEVDDDLILDTRFRKRSGKSEFARNLERLKRRRKGHRSESEDSDEDTPEENAIPSKDGYFEGACPTAEFDDDDADENGFIVDDDGAVPELPTEFSMSTFQDLSNHFKVICQLFVHLCVLQPRKRRSFMKEAMEKTYFSVPLAIARRKLSGLRDSLVTSSVWKPDFKKSLEKSPEFRLEQLDFSIPMCDACHLGNRVSTLRAVLSGKKYDHTTYESKDADGDEVIDWNLGRFCAARAQVFHLFTHWEYHLYHNLQTEIALLHEFSTNNGRFYLPFSNGPPPPDNPEDADGVMDWLDGRGVINSEWHKVKEMMQRAHGLEARGRAGEDDIDVS